MTVLTWSLSEHLTVFTRGSEAGSVESTDLDEVVRVWQHVLQPGLIDCGWNKYTVRSWLRIIVLSPVFDLVGKTRDFSNEMLVSLLTRSFSNRWIKERNFERYGVFVTLLAK